MSEFLKNVLYYPPPHPPHQCQIVGLLVPNLVGRVHGDVEDGVLGTGECIMPA